MFPDHLGVLILLLVETPYMRIGMNDIAEAGVFVWDDGSPVTHMRFRPGEPNDGEDGNCMVLYKGDGGFTDARCDYETFSFCESDYSRLFS